MNLNSIKNASSVFLVVFLLLSSSLLKAQTKVTLQDAIEIALENNFSIKIQNNLVEISKNNNSIGNAGFLPSLNANASILKRVEDNVTEFAALPDRNDEGVETDILSYGINANWVIFDGLKMFSTLDRLSALSEISELDAQIQVENVLYEIITTYYQIVGQQKASLVLENTLETSEQRLSISETRNQIGSGSTYDLLQARADLNADKSALIQSESRLRQAKILVTQVLGHSLSSNFMVEDDISIGEKLMLEDLLEASAVQNRELQKSRLAQRVAQNEKKEIISEIFPQIELSGGYGFNRTESSVGFSNFNETTGIRYGVTARINLFNGFDKQRRRQNADLVIKNELLRQQELEFIIQSEIQRLYTAYEDALTLIALEEENLQYNQQSVDIAIERFSLGTINAVELREAQQSLLNAENRLISAQIDAKFDEIELLRLSGLLLQKTEKG